MELLFAALAGIVLGGLAYLLVRPRTLVGVSLFPALGGIISLLLWEGLTWLAVVPGFDWLRYDRAWIWWIVLGITATTLVALALPIGPRREQEDADLLDRLRRMGRTSTAQRGDEVAASKLAAAEAEADAAAEISAATK
ncbi:hypothetical protein M3D15_07760 [Pseudoclavibacter alba]|uniref:Uncharacterized protein n=1 Tax=Pseudoclavibacter albus TaxID=272241 RepID=A0ABT2HY43_9MICO|nr:hypothetical protein [Pseudoclavibacter alba]MCT2043224.1 hypothetical protein [Pseudoclavibacter alba]